MTTLILALILFQSPPQLDSWTTISENYYELKNIVRVENRTATATSIIGLMRVLQNTNNKNGRALVVFKHPPITFTPKYIAGENLPGDIKTAENYFQKTKDEKLKKLAETSDKILIVKWEELTDNRTNEKILYGTVENWLLTTSGEWIFEESKQDVVKEELLSEGEVLVGFKLSLGDSYHILRLNQSHLGGEK